jgi:von Willebrand factor type A domain
MTFGHIRREIMLKSIARAMALAIVAGSLALAVPAAAKPIVEVAFVLDTTGSMGPLIEGAKRKIWSIATSIIECSPDAEIRMGLVAFRDIGDDYVTKTFPLTTDIQDIYANLLSLQARGGGDWPESVNEALHVGVTKLDWTPGSRTTRIMFLVGDAPPHMDYAQDTKYPEVLAMARRKDITVNAVQAGTARDTERAWRTIAQMGNGEYLPIPQDGGRIVVIETPYDTEILELQGGINRTIIPYGTRSDQSRVQRYAEQSSVAPKPTATEMATYMNKRAKTDGGVDVITGGNDLVADVAAGRQTLNGVKDEELPEMVRGMNAADRKAHLDKQIAERRALNEKLTGLIAKRDRYVAEQRTKQQGKTGDSFDRAVETALRAQIKQ